MRRLRLIGKLPINRNTKLSSIDQSQHGNLTNRVAINWINTPNKGLMMPRPNPTNSDLLRHGAPNHWPIIGPYSVTWRICILRCTIDAHTLPDRCIYLTWLTASLPRNWQELDAECDPAVDLLCGPHRTTFHCAVREEIALLPLIRATYI